MQQYSLAALGGTFDHFHKGHQTFLHYVISVAKKAIIGITRDDIIKDKVYPTTIESYDTRFASVRSFLQQIHHENDAELVPLSDIFGPTLVNPAIDCLVASPLTVQGAEYINNVRKQKGLRPLPINLCPLEKSSDNNYIASTRIREGVINREGFVYETILNTTITLSEYQKTQLKDPFGTLIQHPSPDQIKEHILSSRTVIAVGDETSSFCMKHSVPVVSYIFDHRTQRQPVKHTIGLHFRDNDIIFCDNPAGTITIELVSSLKHAFQTKKHVQVEGEEDLAVLPSILLLPLGSTILYGQPDDGIVAITVTEEKKEWCRHFLAYN